MDKYTPQERAEIVTIFIENNRSIIATQRKLCQKYPFRPVPHKTTIYRIHANFRQYGTTEDRPRSGRPRTSRNAENVALVRDSLAESPETSIRRRGSQLHISARSLRRILKTDLEIFPYEIQSVKKLLPRDPDQQADVNDEVVEPVTKTRGARAAKLTKITKTPIDNEEEEEQPKKSTRAVRNKADPPIKTESKSKKKNSKENGAIQPDENGVDENKGKETKRNTKRKVAEKAENVENSSVTPKKKKIVKEDGKKDTKKAKDTAATNKKATAGTKEAKPAQNQTSTKWNTIDFGNSKKSANGETNNFKITSWNVDGIRAWLKKGGLNIIEHDNPDILCLQETKCSEEKLPEEVTDLEGYHQYWCSSDKEGYAGVGVYTKEEPISVVKGIGDKEQDNEGRCLTLEYDKFYLVNVYVPNAGRGLVTLPKRLNFNESFKAYIKKLDKKKPVIVCGDMNVAHNEIDLKNPKTNKKNAGFTQEERDGMTDFLSDGYIDSLRELYPDQEEIYTFWSYMSNARAKNIGWRLDYFIYSERIKDLICDSVVRSEVYGSDHCPISLFIHF